MYLADCSTETLQ